MLKKSITYKNVFTEESVTEDFYFHLSAADMVELEVSFKGGLAEWFMKAMREEDMEAVYAGFKKMVLKAYGHRGENNKWIQNQQIRDEFENSEAYSVLLMEMLTVEGAFDKFIQAVVPRELREDTSQLKLAPVLEETPETSEPKKLTKEELAGMDANELRSGLATGRYTL